MDSHTAQSRKAPGRHAYRVELDLGRRPRLRTGRYFLPAKSFRPGGIRPGRPHHFEVLAGDEHYLGVETERRPAVAFYQLAFAIRRLPVWRISREGGG